MSDGPRGRKGKIARLPKELRDKVNCLLRDGVSAPMIIKFLDKQEVRGINEQNITNWRQGGYVEWTREQERLADMNAKREYALDLVKANEGSRLHEASMQIAASQLYDVLSDFDPATLKDLLAKHPKNFPAIVNSLSKLAKQALDVEKFKDRVRERDERLLRELRAKNDTGGISDETMDLITRELKLF